MRIYKFRGFHADESGKTIIKLNGKEIRGEWYKGDLSTDGGYYIKEHSVIPETVGQFTGFFDEAEQEIYDGDILKDAYFARSNGGRIFIYSVFWDCKHGDWGARRTDGIEDFIPGVMSREKIGNIFENPELLEVAKNG